MKQRSPWLPVLVLILTTACFNIGIEWSELTFTRTRPIDKDLVGTWTPTAETIQDMKRSGGYAISKHELTLSANAAFSMLNMPDWWRDAFGKSHRQFESGRGTWRIEEANNVYTIYVVNLVFPTHSMRVNLSGQRPPYVMHITLGDPDSGHYMLFEKGEQRAAHDIALQPTVSAVTPIAWHGSTLGRLAGWPGPLALGHQPRPDDGVFHREPGGVAGGVLGETRPHQATTSTVEPTVSRASSARCASATSSRANV